MVAAAVLFLSGCTSGDRVHLTPTARPAARATCSGTGGEGVLRALFGDMSGGRPVVVSDYFTTADRFVRWIDPDSNGALIELPDPADGHPALYALRDHLNALAAGGFQVTVVRFSDAGYFAGAVGEEGGQFVAGLSGRGSASEPVRDGTVTGTVDCATGKLRVVQVDDW